jgi:MFS family permease
MFRTAINRYQVLAVIVLANFSQLWVRVVLGPIVPEIIQSFQVSKTEIGITLTIMWAMYALLQFPSGILADRYGQRRIILTALGLASLGSLLISFATNYALFTLFIVFLGAGAGLFLSVAASLLTESYENTGSALGFLTAGGMLAGLVGPIMASFAVIRFGWRSVPLIGSLVAGSALLLVWTVVTPHKQTKEKTDERLVVDLKTVIDIVTRPTIGITLVIAVIIVFTFQSVLSFFPTFLSEFLNLDPNVANSVFSAIFLFAVIGQPIMGNLSDRYPRDLVLTTNIVAAIVGVITILLVPRLYAAIVASVLLGLALTWFGTLNAIFMDNLSHRDRQVGFGLIRTLYMFFGASGSVVTGAIADGYGWTAAFGVIVGLLSVAGVLLSIKQFLLQELQAYTSTAG